MSEHIASSPIAPNEVVGASTSIRDRLASSAAVEIPPSLIRDLERLSVEVVQTDQARLDASRDWWPISIGWASHGEVPQRPSAIVRPFDTDQVSQILALCSQAGVPITPAGGRSGVCGGVVPLFGGISLDLTGMQGVVAIDEISLTADVLAGTFGPDLEEALSRHGDGFTAGHWPQSMDLSTVGGWLACRGAGQFSTRYGKIEDITAGLVAVLADGTVVDTRHEAPRAATGPSLTQLFLGSEGTLGVITEARLRIHPRPRAHARRAFGFSSFEMGVDACRRILRRGATPAVLRLYDSAESQRNFQEDRFCVLVVLDEADPLLVEATMRVVDEEVNIDVETGVVRLDESLVQHWLDHRNDVSALAPLWKAGIVVDTAEVAGPWAILPDLAREVPAALHKIEGTLVASVHQSHAYSHGACLYFTFAGRQEVSTNQEEKSEKANHEHQQWAEEYYAAAWDALTAATVRHGAAISHHHGIGINRARFLSPSLGPGFAVLQHLKSAMDPRGILNPGKLGFESPFGSPEWP